MVKFVVSYLQEKKVSATECEALFYQIRWDYVSTATIMELSAMYGMSSPSVFSAMQKRLARDDPTQQASRLTQNDKFPMLFKERAKPRNY